jgi:uncharacterized membrane protein
MKTSSKLRIARTLVVNPTLILALAGSMLCVPAYSQQEVNPTWYNPWPEPARESASSSSPRAAKHKLPENASSDMSQKRTGKLRPKRSVTRQSSADRGTANNRLLPNGN